MPYRPLRPSPCVCPPSTPHTSRALSTTMADSGSDLVGQARLWGCHPTGKDCSCWVMAGLLCLAQSRRSRNVCQRKSRVLRRMMGHSEGTVAMQSSQEGLLQVPRTQHSPDLEREASSRLLCLPEHTRPLRYRGTARLASEEDQICHLQLLSHGAAGVEQAQAYGRALSCSQASQVFLKRAGLLFCR